MVAKIVVNQGNQFIGRDVGSISTPLRSGQGNTRRGIGSEWNQGVFGNATCERSLNVGEIVQHFQDFAGGRPLFVGDNQLPRIGPALKRQPVALRQGTNNRGRDGGAGPGDPLQGRIKVVRGCLHDFGR